MDRGRSGHRAKPSRANCPTCGRPFDPQATEAMPFCSQRCKEVDLGRWLNEDIGLPYERSPDDFDEDEYSE
jgi:endogenous inhibitor of DNA gyrase (YacG/DUF329 family)